MAFLVFKTAQAQKLDKKDFAVIYKQMPHKPLPEKVKTYSVKIHPGDISFQFIHYKKQMGYFELGSKTNYGSVEKCENDYLKLPGYERIPTNGDAQIDVYFQKFNVQNLVTKSGKGEFVEGPNQQMVSRTVYFYEFEYSYNEAVKISAGNDVVFDEVYAKPGMVKAQFGSCGDCKSADKNPRSTFGDSYTSQEELDAKFNERFIKDEQIDRVRNRLSEVENYLFRYLGKPFRKIEFTLVTGKGKGLDYSDLDTALLKVKQSFDEISKEGDLAKGKAKMTEALAIWQKALGEFSSDGGNKKARINEEIAAALQYNCGVAQIWLNNISEANVCLDKAAQTKSGNKLAREVRGWLDDYEKRLKANNML